jgi:hypothetical protein
MSRILFFIFIALLITNLNTGCSDRYKFQFERGSNFDRRLLAHTERIFPQQNGVVLWVSNPHVSDPFIQKKVLLHFDKHQKLLDFSDFNNGILTANKDQLICYLRSYQTKDEVRFLQTTYLKNRITGDDPQSNSLIESVKVLDRQHLELHIWVCPTDLYANFKLGQKTISKIDFSLYSVKKILKIKISDCRFDQASDEISISTISGQYCHTNLLRFTNSSQLMRLMSQIILVM